MKKGLVEVYCGTGKGKSTLALGQSVRACAQGKSVIIIQFLKGKESSELEFIEDLSPLDLKIFRFEKSKIYYENLSEQEKAEEKKNILNGLNFAKKVIATEECITVDELKKLMELVDEMHLVLTGDCMPQEIQPMVDCITTLETKVLRERE